MVEDDKFHVGKPPVFNGNNYDYWKKRMEVHFKALRRELWRIVMEGYVILDPKNKSDQDDKNEKLNDRALSVLYNALALSEFNRVKGLEKANEIWEKLMEIYEGTSTVKEAKLYVYKGKFNEFTMKKDEDVSTMFNRLNDIVNELKCLDFDVSCWNLVHVAHLVNSKACTIIVPYCQDKERFPCLNMGVSYHSKIDACERKGDC
jgi:hypothetical protein